MSNRTQRYLVLVTALIIAVAAVWVPQIMRARHRPAGSAEYAWIADIDTWRRTGGERQVLTPYQLDITVDPAALPAGIGPWHSIDTPAPDPEVLGALSPDAYLLRAFQRQDGQVVWHSMVSSRRSASFHLPQVCYRGWSNTLAAEAIPLRDGELHAFSMIARQDDRTHVLYYFYLWPNARRDITEGLLMFKATIILQDPQGVPQAKETLRSFIALWFDKAAPIE